MKGIVAALLGLILIFILSSVAPAESSDENAVDLDVDELDRIEDVLSKPEKLDTSDPSDEKPFLEKHVVPSEDKNGARYLDGEEYLLAPESSFENTFEPIDDGIPDEPTENHLTPKAKKGDTSEES